MRDRRPGLSTSAERAPWRQVVAWTLGALLLLNAGGAVRAADALAQSANGPTVGRTASAPSDGGLAAPPASDDLEPIEPGGLDLCAPRTAPEGKEPATGSGAASDPSATVLALLCRLARLGAPAVPTGGSGEAPAGTRAVTVLPGGGRLVGPRLTTLPLARPGAAAPTGAVAGELREREVLIARPLGGSASEDAALGRDQRLSLISAFASRLLGLRIVRYAIPGNRPLADVLAALALDPRVVLAQPNYVFRAVGSSSGSIAPQYAPATIRLAEAHRLARGRGVRLAVIDTALEADHPELAGAVAATITLVEGGDAPAAHGTSIAGIVAAHDALDGVAPEALLLSVGAFHTEEGESAQSMTYALLNGIEWSQRNGARVVNMSFAGPEDPLLGRAIAAAAARGTIFVAAAGNGGPGAPPAYPAAFPQVIAVTATDSQDALYADANRGAYVAVAAPGVDILAPALSRSYALASGTSFAAAHVSGLVALMLERNPSLTAEMIKEILRSSARRPPTGVAASAAGAGIIDAAAAVERAR